ncbi:MAG: ATP/GTP-binding protein [Promethearchaeota archaeon]
MLFNYIIGPAGSGKTTLANTLYNHISQKYNEISTIIINLDPGVRDLPYNPQIDIRDFLTLEEVMEKYSLGPNGGLIAATDLIIDYIEDIKFEISEYNDPDVVIIDTPGQMELFAFRATGPLVASSLGYGDVKRIVSFLFDPVICREPNGFISTMFLSSSVQFRFLDIPQLNVLSKIDLIEPQITDRIIDWSEDFGKLEDAATHTERGLIKEINIMISRMFEQLGSLPKLIATSSVSFEGIDDYWGTIQRTLNLDESPFY